MVKMYGLNLKGFLKILASLYGPLKQAGDCFENKFRNPDIQIKWNIICLSYEF